MTHPRASRLQFSLRLLLLALTAFAIGFPIWYRWPYEETLAERDPLTGKVIATRISTWQRQWGGRRILHGPQRTTYGDVTATTHYIQGVMHGPFTVRDAKGRMSQRGQYVDGFREGKWEESDHGASSTTYWHQDQLDGTIELKSRKGKTVTATFANGRLVAYNGQPCADLFFESLKTKQIDETTEAALQQTTSVDLVEMPLKDAMLFFADTHGIPIVVDTVSGLGVDMPITETLRGLDLRSTLTLLAVPREIGCDYRYGCLWITTAEDAKDWRDPTGVAEIRPPEDSALARAWNEPAVVDVVDIPLSEVLATIAQPLNIHIYTTQIEPTAEDPAKHPVTLNIRGVPFRHVLGQLLYNTGCRCRLEGDKLIILPPDAGAKVKRQPALGPSNSGDPFAPWPKR